MVAEFLAFCAGILLVGGLADAAASRRRSRPAGGQPVRWARLAARLGRAVGAPGPPASMASRMAAAGLPDRVQPAEVMAVKAGTAAAAALLSLGLFGGHGVRTSLIPVLVAAAAGFLAPDMWLMRRAGDRARQARLELPAALDLLRVSVAAGMPAWRALAETGRRGSGIVASELSAAAARAGAGEERECVLARLMSRAPLPEIEILVAALRRSERHGVPLSPALSALAVDARAARARELREQAARAAPRIQLAVALLLVPAVMLLIAAVVVHSVL